jgi:hypothetical protein
MGHAMFVRAPGADTVAQESTPTPAVDSGAN